MQLRIRNELILLNILVVVLVISSVFAPSTVLSIILGLPTVLFFPGYTLIVALFPRKEGMSGIERIALSFGMSIVVVPLIGLVVNYTPWGIGLEPLLYSITAFIFVMSFIAWFRRRRVVEEERFGIDLKLALPSLGVGVWDRTLSIVLLVVILGALGTLGYVIVKPKAGEGFTGFYILGQEGKAIGYPEELTLGEETTVMVGVVNEERETTTYRIEVTIDGIKNNEVEAITLEHEEKWEQEVSFVPRLTGDNQEVEFLLYKDGQAEPCFEPLYLRINVRQ